MERRHFVGKGNGIVELHHILCDGTKVVVFVVLGVQVSGVAECMTK